MLARYHPSILTLNAPFRCLCIQAVTFFEIFMNPSSGRMREGSEIDTGNILLYSSETASKGMINNTRPKCPTQRNCRHKRHRYGGRHRHYLLGSGVSIRSPSAFLFIVNPNATFVSSFVCGTADMDIREKPGLGADEPPFGSELVVAVCGAGRVTKAAAS